jgi:eukaryotic-like serine/threonine-protein kinase
MLGVQGERSAEKLAIGKYRIVSQLGQGGTADVYLAVADGPAGFRKLVVLKVLRQNLSSDDQFRAMFLGEAKLSARLHHPNVVQTNEVLEVDGTPVIVMEYLEGQPLSQVIVRGRDAGFTQAMQLRVLVDALHGLHAAHELTDFDGTALGVVHRDVSPQNIFVTLEGQTKVLDFGIAKIERSVVETEVGTIKGKLRYMAPEQIAGERLSRRADIYAAGVILWEALVGERMWKGCSEAEIRARVVQGDLVMPETMRANVPPELVRVCHRALALAPADRQATTLEFADDLEAALPALGPLPSQREIGATVARLFEDVRAMTKGALERVSRTDLPVLAPLASPASEAPVPDRQLNHSGRRVVRGGVRIALGGAVALVIGAAFFVAWRNGHDRGSRPQAPAASSGAPKTAPAEAEIPVDRAADPLETQAAVAPEASLRRTNARNTVAGRLPKRPQRTDAPTESGPGAAAQDCDHPFFFDANGIKKFRPECM